MSPTGSDGPKGLPADQLSKKLGKKPNRKPNGKVYRPKRSKTSQSSAASVNDFLPERGGWRNVGDSVIARYPRWFVEYIEGMQANHALLPFYMMMMNVSNTDLPPDPIADHLEAQASALVAEAIKAYYEAAQKLSSDFSGVPGPTSTMEEDILKTQCAKRYYVAWRVCRSNRIVDDDVRAKYPKWFCELLEAFDDWFRQGFRAY